MPHPTAYRAPVIRLRMSSFAVALALGLLLIGCSSSDGGGDAAGPTTTTSTTAPTTVPVTPTIPVGREVEIHVPPGYQKGTPAPLLVTQTVSQPFAKITRIAKL